MNKFLFGVVLSWPMASAAQDATNSAFPDYQLTYGFGFVGASGVYVGQDDEVFPFPLLSLSINRFELSIAKGLQYRIWENEDTQLAAALTYNVAPDTPNTSLFDGLDRDDWVGAELSVAHDFGVFDLAFAGQIDVSDTHDGGQAELSIGRAFPMGAVIVEGRIGVTFLDENQADYLYGVTADEATAMRAVFDADSSWTPHIDLSVLYPMSDGTALAGFFRHEELPDEISDSPLVGATERTTIGISLVRSF